VKTTIKAYHSDWVLHADGNTNFDAGVKVDIDAKMCAGGGLGAIILNCLPLVRNDMAATAGYQASMNTDLVNEGDDLSNEFSITWSYTTSDDPGK